MKGYFEKMKKFVLAFGIPVLAVASLIGSGYATWYFNSNVITANKGIAVEPTEKRVVGAEFRPSGEIKLVLDQPVKTDGMPDGRKDVHFEGTFSESLVANGDTNMFVKGTSYTVTTTITIPSEIATYVNFTFEGSTASEDGLTLAKTHTYKVEDENQNAFEVFKISDKPSVTSDVTVAYTAKEPKDSAEYDTMRGAMTDPVSGEFNKSISIEFKAVIVK